jgi:hypothetical protein
MANINTKVTTQRALMLGATTGLFGLCLMGPSTFSISQALAVITSVGLGAVVPGYCLTFYSQPVTSTERLLLAAVYGTILWSLGVFLSSFFGIYEISYFPTAACFFWSMGRFRKRKEPRFVVKKSFGNSATVLGGLAGVVALIPSLTKTLSLQRTNWAGFWAFHIDLPFHISLVAEAAQRIPKVYPYADDTELRYTWLTHGALGFLSRISRVPAFDLVLQFWPIIAATALSFLISALAWKTTSNSLATVVAPIIAACLRGPRLGASSYLDFHLLAPYSLSRDLGTIWLLALVLHLMKVPLTKSSGRKSLVIDTAIVLLITFMLSGGKGSMLPLVLGSVLGGAVLVSLHNKRLLNQSLRIFAASAIGLFSAQILVVKSSGHLQIQLFSFVDAIPSTTNKWALLWLALPVLLALMVLLQILLGHQTAKNLGSWVLALLPLLGLVGLSILGHPGKGQLYFWTTIAPFLAIGLAMLLGAFYRDSDIFERFIAVAAWFSWPLIGHVTHQVNEIHQFVWTLFACGVGAVVIYLKRMFCGEYASRKFWTSIPVVIGVLFLGGLQLSEDQGLAYDTGASSNWEGAVHQEQLVALKLLRQESRTSERFITNKHCTSGSVVNETCYGRWFLASAISERRTPIEGYSYTWRNLDGPYWNTSYLAQLDDFILNPTKEGRKYLIEDNIHWVFIDARYPFSVSLDEVSTLIYNGEFAKLYHLG